MRPLSHIWLAVILAGCSSTTEPSDISEDDAGSQPAGAGGTRTTTPGDGGRAGGGRTSAGGATGAGGTKATGGATGAGGTKATGGAPNTGGAPGAGGTTEGSGGSGPVPPITGTPGVWENVSPAGHPELFDVNDPGCAACNYGSLGVVADSAHPGTFYTSFCYHGVWKSSDWGITWAKVSEAGGPMDNGGGRLAIAPDGSYLIAWILFPHNGYQNAAWISTDGGVTFTQHDLPIPDPMLYAILFSDKTRVVAANHQHEINHLFESTDSGQTWSDQGSIFKEPTLGSPALHWVDADTLLAVDDGDTGDGGGTYRGVRSGSTWPWSWSWTKVSDQQHFHAYHQLYVDRDNDVLYNGGSFGIERSTNKGLTWQKVSSTYSSSIIGTGTKIYSTANYASIAGFGPWLMVADRGAGTNWVPWKSPTNADPPAAMNNGWAWAAVGNDGQHYVIVGGDWLAGLWRYVEP